MTQAAFLLLLLLSVSSAFASKSIKLTQTSTKLDASFNPTEASLAKYPSFTVDTRSHETQFKSASSSKILSSKSATTNESVFNYLNMQYTTEITIGSEKQEFTVLADTGSPTLWVKGSQCKMCQGWNSNLFDCESSSTCEELNQKQTIFYGSGELLGNDVQDKITWGDIEYEAVFLEAGIVSSDFTTYFYGDGILGLGNSNEDVGPPSTLTLEAIFGIGSFDEEALGVYLNDKANSEGSIMTFGGFDSSYFEGSSQDINYHEVTGTEGWFVDLSGFYYETPAVSGFLETPNYEVVIDTGTSMILLPFDTIVGFMTTIETAYEGIECSLSSGILGCVGLSDDPDMSLFPPLELELGGVDYSIDPEFYLSYCITGFGEFYCGTEIGYSGFLEIGILGQPFIREYYSVYDYGNNRVGLARSINKGNDLNSLLIHFLVSTEAESTKATKANGEKPSLNAAGDLGGVEFLVLSVLGLAAAGYACFHFIRKRREGKSYELSEEEFRHVQMT